MSKDPPSSYLDQYPLRLPDGMRDHLKQEAAESQRSMNAEIIYRLEQSFAVDGLLRGNKSYGGAAIMDEILQTAERLACLIEEKKDTDSFIGRTDPKGTGRMTRNDTSLSSDYYKLRLPDGLRAQIKEQSIKNKNSMNAEIIRRVEHSLAADALRRNARTRDLAVIVDDILATATRLTQLIQDKYALSKRADTK